MISIIILIFLVRYIGVLATRKGQQTRKWKLRTIGTWLLGDLAGELIVFYFFGLDLVLFMVFGPGMGYLGFLLVKQKLDALPDASN